MKKTFEYAVGDSWLLDFQGEKTVYTVKDCRYRPADGKEIYTVEIGGTGSCEMTKNRLHYLLYRFVYKKLKSGKYRKYDCGMSETEVRAYYAHMRAAEEQRAERVTARLESSAEYRAAAQEISALSMQLAKAEYIRADAFEIVRLKKQLDAAKEKRRTAMTRLGIKPGEEKKRMFCTKCGDTGYLSGGKQCVCVAANEEAIRAYAAGVRKCKAAT